MPFKYRPYDARLQHRAPASAAVTADATVDTITQKAQTRTEYATKVYVEAIDVGDGDEKYECVSELSNDKFTTVDAIASTYIQFGDATQLRSATDTAAGDYAEMFWSTEVNGVAYRYWRLVLVAAGTSPSITYHAFSTLLE